MDENFIRFGDKIIRKSLMQIITKGRMYKDNGNGGGHYHYYYELTLASGEKLRDYEPGSKFIEFYKSYFENKDG